ncbi:hypothetical protein [Marinilabilia sp.]|uniref:hypothetical protein n=1 Tax=Marinilabilia sp. TaxID=2021252 RepID=UPI0025B7BC08|nr:hypothetical protein [Marinilabilia sp.]
MNRELLLFAVVAILSFGFISCNSAQKKQDEKKVSDAVEENYEGLKEELNDVGTAISDLFETEKADFKSTADEVLDDIDRKVETIKQKISGTEDDGSLKNKLHKLEQEADNLEKELKELDDKTEEEWNKARQNIEDGFKNLKRDVEEFFD